MKKFVALSVLVLIILVGCKAKENYAENIVGYWMDGDGNTVSFTGDTCTIDDEVFNYKVYDNDRLQLSNKDYNREYIVSFDKDNNLSLISADMSSTNTYTKDIEKQKAILYNQKFGVYEEDFKNLQINEEYKPYLNLCIEKMQLQDNKEYYYFLYDVDKDEVPELFLESSTCEADKKCEVYKLKRDKTELIGDFSFGYLCGSENSVLSVYQHMDYQHIERYYIKNNILKEEKIIEGVTDNYLSLEGINMYKLNDVYGLNWNGNPETMNDKVLDMYINGELETEEVQSINDENINTVLKIEKDDNWYDNGIFSTFYKTYFDDENYSWEYVGDIYGQLIPNYNEYSIIGYEIYRVESKIDGESGYFFVPFNRYTPMIDVYEYREGDLNLVWYATE